MGLTRCYKTAVLYVYICCFSISIHSWEITTSELRKQTDIVWKFYFRFRFWTFYRHRSVNMHIRNKFFRIGRSLDDPERVMMLCRFSEMAAIRSQIYFRFLVLWRLAFRKAKNYLRTKFRPDISIHRRDITNKYPPYLNSTPVFDFDLFTIIRFCDSARAC